MTSLPQETTATTLTPEQEGYFLTCGKRFRVGDASASRIVAIIDVYSGWLEFEFETEDGVRIPGAYAVKTPAFRSSILKELTQLSTAEAERRGYR
jgi:hypothetical protein